MVHPVLRPVVANTRRALRTVASRQPKVRRLLQVAARELQDALADDVYGGHYFGQGRNAMDRAFMSGYERYDRDTSHANVAAYLLWKTFPARTVLDVGCATGFVVEALRELGLDAKGVDLSQYAVDNAAQGAKGHLQRADLLGRLPFPRAHFDLVTAFETLEHLPPGDVAHAVQELRRVARSYVVATIPSFGPNPNGPAGWLEIKVRDEKVDEYYALGPGYEGPVPFEDLYRDVKGDPIEGHLTIASFSWWTKQFESAGFIRCGAVERRIHPDLARFGLTKYWNLYVFRTPEAPEPPPALRAESEIAAVERRFGLEGRTANEEDLALLAASPAGSGAERATPPNS